MAIRRLAAIPFILLAMGMSRETGAQCLRPAELGIRIEPSSTGQARGDADALSVIGSARKALSERFGIRENEADMAVSGMPPFETMTLIWTHRGCMVKAVHLSLADILKIVNGDEEEEPRRRRPGPAGRQ